MKCAICNTEFEGKPTKKTCSTKCRVTLSRQNVTLTPSVTKLTAADKDWTAKDPDYYKFSEETFDRKCPIDNKPFKTRLELLKFCSRECGSQVMVLIARAGQKMHGL